jgi:hypothetical protein
MTNDPTPSPQDPTGITPKESQPLPTLQPPSTKTPVQFNQQVNVYQQIPPSAWDSLSQAQVFELTKDILKLSDVLDKRHYDHATNLIDKRSARDRISMFIGGAIAFLGIGGAIYLGTTGHDIIALSISLPLATILAVVVGRRLL